MKWIDRILNRLDLPRIFSDPFATFEDPIRYEIFSAERLEEHGESLAAKQKVTDDPRRGRRLTPRIQENGRVLLASYHAVAETVSEQRAITPPAEWLLDNFHIVDEQLRDIRDHLPARYYRELPKLAGGPLKSYPRIYELAWSFVAHTDSRFEPEMLIHFIRSYQRIQPLTIGELWAVPITLRIVLIENLRRIAVRIVGSERARLEADQIADDLLGISGRSLQTARDAMQARGKRPLPMAFAVQLVQRLRNQGADASEAMQWLTETLAAQGTTPDEIVLGEHSLQSAANVTVRNIITGMRHISVYSWNDFFEEVSLVDEVLRADSLFAEMDFVTRDRYRHGLEDLAKGARRQELEVARFVIAKAEYARMTAGKSDEAADWRPMDPGYYLISKGRPAFEAEIGFRPSLRQRILRRYIVHATPAYLGSVMLGTLLLAGVPLLATFWAAVSPVWLCLFGILALLPASDIAIMLTNRLLTAQIGPRHLPRLELAGGIPSALRTFVVVPTLLVNEAETEEQIALLEVHYLANPDGDVRFALLTDWPDSDAETLPGDTALLRCAAERIEQLNALHGPAPDGAKRFFFMHRKRLWNEGEGKWMGWERKRGKLHEFNRLLRGATDTSFIPIDGASPMVPSNVRYVITLDADTRLPVKAVSELVGSMAHPLNLPRVDERLGRVMDGYGVLQPRIIPSFPTRRDRSLYHRLFTGPCGVDPYALAVSNIYQDLFGEGSFTGKGIYDVDAFEVALAGRVPTNTILSHDLFEGIFARCALASDITLFEEFPSHAEVAASRLHRWTRGDWQLLPWIFGRRGKGIPGIERWKMIDNLRRSLSAPGMVVLLLASWLISAAPSWVWTLFVLIALAFPALLSLIAGLLPQRRGISKRNHLRAVLDDLLEGAGHTAASLTLLAHQAWLMVDAVGRTLVRLFITRRRLLEWMTAAQAKKSSCHSYSFFFRRMLDAEIIAFAAMIMTAFLNPQALPVAFPIIFLWIISPVVARKISMPPATRPTEILKAEDVTHLRLVARRTWRFFTTFVTAEDHWLPPDNFQEEPHPVIAHRSSPTNFGLYLLSVVAARDFGWVGLSAATDKLEDSLATLERLPRFRGHFYNWYETRELRTLEPKYISSVDSGNLAGHLLALSQACKEMIASPIVSPAARLGILDTAMLLHGALQGRGKDRTAQQRLLEIIKALKSRGVGMPPVNFAVEAAFWTSLETSAEAVAAGVITSTEEPGGGDSSEAASWAELLLDDIRSHRRDIDSLFPWTPHLGEGSPEGQGRAEEEENIFTATEELHAPGTSLARIPALCAEAVEALQTFSFGKEYSARYDTLIAALQQSREACRLLVTRLDGISERARRLFDEMDFSFLFEPECRLFSIGYRADDGRLDPSFYDLLASEARLTSFIAIAKGEAPPSHWFQLSRTLVPVGKGASLVSWSGSMFEYLMPSLIMFTPRGSLLDQTCRIVIARQINYGGENGVPWGVSESAYNTRDLSFAYQYTAFGIPGLGLKRGLGQDLVVAPYATILAAMYAPAAAAQNLKRLDKAGGRGTYSFYEALDFTRGRLPEGTRASVIKAYMAHHQGMSLVALDNVIHDGIMRHRFHREPIVHAAELLLQERMPRDVGVARPLADQVQTARVWETVQPVLRRFHSPSHRLPSTHLLSNGRYAVMVTAAGSGYSRWQDLAVTRWREDGTRDAWGSYIYLRDTENGAVWSATFQPTGTEPNHYEVTFAEDRARITRHDGTLTTALEIILSPEDDAELRHLSITNKGTQPRHIEVTSYAEVVLASQGADVAHPAFSNLFVRTEYHPEVTGLLAHRRPRSADARHLWAAHVIAVAEGGSNGLEYETDRMRFIGRGQTIRRPAAIMDGRPLSNTVGPVLDPIFSLRIRVRIAPGTTTHLTFSTMVAATREAALLLADKYHDPAAFEQTSTHVWTHSQIQLHYLGIDRGEAHLFQHLANRLLYSDPAMRPRDEVLKQSALNVTAVWKFGVSGDYPIVLARVDDVDDLGIVRQLLRAHEYWRLKLMEVDLVILNEKESSYIQELQRALEGMVNSSLGGHALQENRGRIFVLRVDLLSPEERLLLQTAARAVLSARDGSLTEQVMRMRRQEQRTVHPARRQFPRHPTAETALETPPLEFFNGWGGFCEEGREYVIVLDKGRQTPAPWLNIIANESFGFQVSESGAGYTWALNSRENQLTPWSNDPVSDPSGEAFYIRDRDSGALWTPTALPIRIENATYIARHGQGYSRFEHLSHGVWSELTQFVSRTDPIKMSLLALENRSAEPRRLSVTAYLEWVLGFTRTISAPYIVTEVDEATGAMFARNPWHAEFGDGIAFADLGGRQTAWTADRIEFIGRNGSLEQPAGLIKGTVLSGRTGAGLDPCSVLQCSVDLAPGERVELVLVVGQVQDRDSARELIKRWRAVDPRQELAAVRARWEQTLGKIQVKTPDRSMDIMLNRWFLYQTLVCRFWARAAFYQAGGAYGFRDQLQDCLALVVTDPALVRAHIIRASGRQFREGDVQHWWHPPTGRGVRTYFSDDLLWLPYTVSNYLEVTRDTSILDETTFFLEGEPIPPEREDVYFEPRVADEAATVYEHCARALDLRLVTGEHGLPLMGTGDWNDGMNRVGHEGRGESVWLAWFLHAVLCQFAPVAAGRGELTRAERWRTHAVLLKEALEKEAWDGAWYRRAYYDDGTPLGSAANTECRIDSIAQNWGVISGAADPERSRRAMQSVGEFLIRPGDGLILLFTPPFDKTLQDPGYIKGYLPGTRENGGQYTHAAAWTVIAFALLGNGDLAHELFTMINPVTHGASRTGVHRYRVEPYVAVADVYSEPPHVGRGGWSWYTGSSGWLYRAGLEWILGLAVRGETLRIDPCIPRNWQDFAISYRHKTTRYEISVENPNGVMRGVVSLELDGDALPAAEKTVPLKDDGREHVVKITLG